MQTKPDRGTPASACGFRAIRSAAQELLHKWRSQRLCKTPQTASKNHKQIKLSIFKKKLTQNASASNTQKEEKYEVVFRS
jgi:hypothetical protein